MRARRFLLVALVALAGCDLGGDERSEPTRVSPRTESPRKVMAAFVDAAVEGDAERAWDLLSSRAKQRLTPRESIARVGRSRYRLFLSVEISPRFAVAAVQGNRWVFAAALRLERGRWRVELGGPISMRAERPEPHERVGKRTQVAAEAKAQATIDEAGLWLDGQAFESRGGGAKPSELLMFGEAASLARGRHTVVAFVSAANEASALAWIFSAEGRGPPPA